MRSGRSRRHTDELIVFYVFYVKHIDKRLVSEIARRCENNKDEVNFYFLLLLYVVYDSVLTLK